MVEIASQPQEPLGTLRRRDRHGASWMVGAGIVAGNALGNATRKPDEPGAR
jgi:hypothetical protein